MTGSRKFTIAFAVITLGGLAGLFVWGAMLTPASQPQSSTQVMVQSAAASVPKPQHDPTPEEPTQVQQEDPYLATENRLRKQLFFVHDNGGSKAEQCALILELRMNAQQSGNAERYRAWQGVNAQEMLFERDAKARGIDDVRHVSKKEDKVLQEFSVSEPFCS